MNETRPEPILTLTTSPAGDRLEALWVDPDLIARVDLTGDNFTSVSGGEYLDPINPSWLADQIHLARAGEGDYSGKNAFYLFNLRGRDGSIVHATFSWDDLHDRWNLEPLSD